jgi:hypothetical protein
LTSKEELNLIGYYVIIIIIIIKMVWQYLQISVAMLPSTHVTYLRIGDDFTCIDLGQCVQSVTENLGQGKVVYYWSKVKKENKKERKEEIS